MSLLTLLVWQLICGSAWAQPVITGRNAAMAEAGVLSSLGVQGVGWNPAVLGLKNAPRLSCLLPSSGVMMGNNSVSPRYMNDMFVTGKHLTAGDKNDILDQLADNELRVFGRYNVPLLAASYQSYAVNLFEAHMTAYGEIPKDIVHLVFTGGDSAKVYRLDDVEAQSILYWSSSFSLARQLPPWKGFRELSAGLTLRYLHGMSFVGLERTDGWFQIIGDTIHAVGAYKTLDAGRGAGVGMDLGVVGWWEPADLYLGMTLGNLLGTIRWRGVQMEEKYFERHSGVDVDSVSYDSYWRHFFHDRDTTYRADSRSSTLPAYFILALRKPGCWLKGRADLNVAWNQGLTREPSGASKPRLAIGSEITARSWLLVRMGMGIGGQTGWTLGAGAGLKFQRYQLDIGGSWQRGIFSGAKGLTLALTNYLSVD